MDTWIIIAIGAAFLQNARSMLQKQLVAGLGTVGASFARFGFGLPFAIFYLLAIQQLIGFELPPPNPSFLLWVAIGGYAQIGGTIGLVAMFSFRNFTAGSAYSRLQAVMAGILAFIIFGETLDIFGIAAILISMVGVLVLSFSKSQNETQLSLKNLFQSVFSKPTLIGISSGASFGLASVAYRQATLELGDDWFVARAAMVLLFSLLIQTASMLIWFALRDRSMFAKIWTHKKACLYAGFFGATASFGWFAAFALQQAALVKAVAQIEVIFTYLTSLFIFKERVSAREIFGCALIISGIFVLILS